MEMPVMEISNKGNSNEIHNDKHSNEILSSNVTLQQEILSSNEITPMK
jgi:cytoskeletal protein CcmA (bactofilin family)